MLIRNHRKIVLSKLIVQLYDWNESCQKFNFEQHWFSWSTFQDASFSPKQSPKFSRFEKIKDFTNLTNISDLIMECFSQDKSCQKLYFTYISMINFLFCTVVPPGASKVDQTHKIRSYTILSDFTGQCFDRNEWCQQCYLQQL